MNAVMTSIFTEVWERTKRLDLLNDAADTKQAGDFPEHWQAIHVEATPE